MANYRPLHLTQAEIDKYGIKIPPNINTEKKEITEDNLNQEVNKPPKMNMMIGGSKSTKVKYGENYESLAGRDWQKVLIFGAMEGGLIVLTFIGITLGLGFIMLGVFKLRGWETFWGGVLICIGIVSGIVAYQLHDRI